MSTETTTDELPIPDGAFTTPTTQPAIDLSACKPGDMLHLKDSECTLTFYMAQGGMFFAADRLRMYRFTQDGKYEGRTSEDWNHLHVASITPDPRDEEIARLKAELSDVEFVRNRNMPWAEKAQEYLDSGKWAGLPLMQGLITELQERDQQLTAANAKVDELEKECADWDKFRLFCRQQDVERTQQIAHLTKENTKLNAEAFEWDKTTKILAEDKEQLKRDHTAELARVLTGWYAECSLVTPDEFLIQTKFQDHFRWNGEGFVGVDREPIRPKLERAVERLNADSIAGKVGEKDGPEQVEPCLDCGRSDGLHRLQCRYHGQNYTNKDPLDEPVTRRELVEKLKQAGVIYRSDELRGLAEALEGGRG